MYLGSNKSVKIRGTDPDTEVETAERDNENLTQPRWSMQESKAHCSFMLHQSCCGRPEAAAFIQQLISSHYSFEFEHSNSHLDFVR